MKLKWHQLHKRGFTLRKTWTCTIAFKRTISLHVTFVYTFIFRLTSQREHWQTATSITASGKCRNNILSNAFEKNMNAHGETVIGTKIMVLWGTTICHFLSVLVSDPYWEVHVTAWPVRTGYTWHSPRLTCSLAWIMLQVTHILMTSHTLVLFYMHTVTFWV